MQTNFPFLAVLKAPRRAPDSLVARANSDAQALAVSLYGHKQAAIAAALGISGAYLSQIKRGTRPLPDRLVTPLCYLTGTLLIQQRREFAEALANIKGRSVCVVAAMAAELRSAA